MTPNQIKRALADAGLRQVDIVKKAGLPKTSRPIVSMVIHGLSRSRKIEATIASSIGRTKKETFPAWYAKNTSISPATSGGTPKFSNTLSAEESSSILDMAFGSDADAPAEPYCELRNLFGLSVAHQSPEYLIGALLCTTKDYCAYSAEFNPYPPSSKHHAGVETGWRMAHAAMNSDTTALPGTL